MADVVATGSGASHGVLFRDAAAIENLLKVDALIVDKTGTLTEGQPVFDRVVAATGFEAGGLRPPGNRRGAWRGQTCGQAAFG